MITITLPLANAPESLLAANQLIRDIETHVSNPLATATAVNALAGRARVILINLLGEVGALEQRLGGWLQSRECMQGWLLFICW